MVSFLNITRCRTRERRPPRQLRKAAGGHPSYFWTGQDWKVESEFIYSPPVSRPPTLKGFRMDNRPPLTRADVPEPAFSFRSRGAKRRKDDAEVWFHVLAFFLRRRQLKYDHQYLRFISIIYDPHMLHTHILLPTTDKQAHEDVPLNTNWKKYRNGGRLYNELSAN